MIRNTPVIKSPFKRMTSWYMYVLGSEKNYTLAIYLRLVQLLYLLYVKKIFSSSEQYGYLCTLLCTRIEIAIWGIRQLMQCCLIWCKYNFFFDVIRLKGLVMTGVLRIMMMRVLFFWSDYMLIKPRGVCSNCFTTENRCRVVRVGP